jgi:hypothetical protein
LAQLFPLRDQAFGTTGAILDGAKLYTYDSIATTTPKATYTNSALTVPHANPIVADSSGVFPQIYAASGEAYHAILKTSAGVTVQTFENWEALGGDDASVFSKDYGANGRVQIVGNGGMPNLEFGDPTGDDLGGDGRIGGWDGTQATTLELDAATTTITGNLALTGNLTVSGTSPFIAVHSSGTATAAATTDIALPSTYNAYRLELSYITPAGGATSIEALFAFDGVPTFKTGVDDYGWVLQNSGPSAGSLGSGSSIDASDARIEVMNVGAPTAGSPCHCSITIMSRYGKETGLSALFESHEDGAYGFYIGRATGQTRAKNYGKATHIRLQPTTGTLSFYWTLTGLPSL